VSCIEVYDPELKLESKKLVVEAAITDVEDYINIQLGISAGYNEVDPISDPSLNQAKVEIIDDLGKTISFVQNQEKTGLFTSEKVVKGAIGRKYKLKIQHEGRVYESTADQMLPVAPIKAFRHKYEKNLNLKPKEIGKFDLFVDVEDPANEENYYLWTMKHYRRIKICFLKRPPSFTIPLPFDQYPCCTPCWQIRFSPGAFTIASDRRSNGKTIGNQLIGSVLYDSRSPYFLIVEQKSLSRGAYEFLRVLQAQTSNTGGIFDTPPQKLQSNIFNVADAKEQVLGYFFVSSVARKPIIFDRFEPGVEPFEERIAIPLGPILESCRDCKDSATQTTRKPFGWDDTIPISEYWLK
jgi:hypothetical protein